MAGALRAQSPPDLKDSPAKHAVVMAEAVVPRQSTLISSSTVVVASGRWLLQPIPVPRTDNTLRRSAFKKPRTTASVPPMAAIAETKAALAGAIVAAVKRTPHTQRSKPTTLVEMQVAPEIAVPIMGGSPAKRSLGNAAALLQWLPLPRTVAPVANSSDNSSREYLWVGFASGAATYTKKTQVLRIKVKT
eukprot:COSAG05_NODE_8634_length_685_cov_10.455631_1_plen_189_part_10